MITSGTLAGGGMITAVTIGWEGGTMTGNGKTVLDDGSDASGSNAAVLQITDGTKKY